MLHGPLWLSLSPALSPLQDARHIFLSMFLTGFFFYTPNLPLPLEFGKCGHRTYALALQSETKEKPIFLYLHYLDVCHLPHFPKLRRGLGETQAQNACPVPIHLLVSFWDAL